MGYYADIGQQADDEIARLQGIIDGGGGETEDWDPHDAHADLLERSYGHGRSVTGGAGGEIRVVQKWSDLRTFLAENGARIILFDKKFDGAELTTTTRSYFYRVGTDKTVLGWSPDGERVRVTLPDGPSRGLRFFSAKNVLISGLRFTSVDRSAFEIQDSASGVWLHDCQFDGCGLQTESENTTISASQFVGAELAHDCDDGHLTLNENEYTRCERIASVGKSASVHANKCNMEWHGDPAIECALRYYSTSNVYQPTEGASTAIQLIGQGRWGTDGNDNFNGSTKPDPNISIAVPYPV